MNKILILNDTSDQQNWGAQLGAKALKNMLRDKPFDLDTLSYGWIESKNQLQDSGSFFGRYQFSKKRTKNLLPIISDEFDYVVSEWTKYPNNPMITEFVKKAKSADIIILNGEGSIYRNNQTAIKGLFLLWYSKNVLNKSSYFVNGMVHLTKVDPILPAIVNKVFSVIDGVYIRDPRSLTNLLQFYPSISAEMIPDSVFSLYENKKIFRSENKDKRYCLFSPPMLITAIPDIYRSGIKYSYLYKLVEELKIRFNRVIILGKEPRDLVLRQLAIDSKVEFFGPENSDSDFINIVKNADFIVSGRYHHLIVSSLFGVPFIPLSTTSHKIEGLCDLFGSIVGKTYDSTDLKINFNDILMDIDNCLENRELISSKILLKVKEISLLAQEIPNLLS